MVEDFTYLGTVISRNGKISQEISNRIKNANNVYYQICNTVVGKREVDKRVKIHIFKAIYLPTILYGSGSWVLLEKLKSRIVALEMKYLRRVVSRTRRDHIRNSRIREELEVNPLTEMLEKRQLKWFGHVCWMDEDRGPRNFFEARPTGKRPRGRPRMSWRDRDRWHAWIEAPPHWEAQRRKKKTGDYINTTMVSLKSNIKLRDIR